MKRWLLILTILLCACATANRPATLAIDGRSVFVDDGGRAGIPVVFIHGNGGSSVQWRAQLAHLRAAGRRALAIDLPGFGQSQPAADPLTLASAAASIDRVVASLGIRRMVLVGHSWGGAVVATYAAAHPDKLAGVVYVDAAAVALPLTSEQEVQLRAALQADPKRVLAAWFGPMLKPSSEAVRREVLDSAERTPSALLLDALMSLRGWDAKNVVEAYRGPRLAIVASDITSPMSFDRQFPDVPAVRIRGAGHWVMLDQPDQVNTALDAFLGKL